MRFNIIFSIFHFFRKKKIIFTKMNSLPQIFFFNKLKTVFFSFQKYYSPK